MDIDPQRAENSSLKPESPHDTDCGMLLTCVEFLEDKVPLIPTPVSSPPCPFTFALERLNLLKMLVSEVAPVTSTAVPAVCVTCFSLFFLEPLILLKRL